MQDTAIASMLAAKLAGEFHLVSANVVNHARLSWVHAQLGAWQVRRGQTPASCHSRVHTYNVCEICLPCFAAGVSSSGCPF